MTFEKDLIDEVIKKYTSSGMLARDVAELTLKKHKKIVEDVIGIIRRKLRRIKFDDIYVRDVKKRNEVLKLINEIIKKELNIK